jgi:hypothetical protein
MKRLKSFLFLLVILIVILFILDYFTTKKLYHVNTKQNWVLNLKNRNIDYVVVGSSKTESGIDVKEIQNLTGLKGINISISGIGIQEQYIIFSEFIQFNKTKTLLLMVDFTTLNPNEFSYPFHEYLYFHRMDNRNINSIIYENSSTKKYLIWKYLPFIRYAEFNSEFKQLIFNKHKLNIDSYGFLKPTEFIINDENHKKNVFDAKLHSVKNTIPGNGKIIIVKQAQDYFLKILDLCSTKNIEVILFSPAENTNASVKFEKKIRPQTRNYFKAISKKRKILYWDFTNSSFSLNPTNFTNDHVHLNPIGVKKFNPIIADSLTRYYGK